MRYSFTDKEREKRKEKSIEGLKHKCEKILRTKYVNNPDDTAREYGPKKEYHLPQVSSSQRTIDIVEEKSMSVAQRRRIHG